MRKLVSLLFACLFLTSCGTRNATQQTTQMQTEKAVQEVPVNKEVTFVVEDTLYQSKLQKGKWDIHYPNLEGDMTKSCNQIILAHIKKMIDEIDLEQEVDIILNYDIKTQTDKVFSVLFTGNYNAKGAAHPVNVSFSINYDWRMEKELQLSDVVADPETLVAKCKEAVPKQCEKEFQAAFEKLPEERIREQILEESSFYLQDGRINVRLAIPAGAFYYQYVSCDIETY